MEYSAGTCNIGEREQRKRYFLGAAGFASAGILVILSSFGYLDAGPSLLLSALLFVGFNGFIQGRLEFCAGYGMLGKQNADDTEPKSVSEEGRRRDLLEAVRIQLYSLFGTALVYGIYSFTVQPM